jgi:protein-disulfide isomerase
VTRLSASVTERDHILGPAGAAVTLVEYGDFECPHCGRAAPVVRRLREEMGDAFRFAFRHFPVNLGHAHAQLAAEAAEAAAAQERFWEMHDRLFANQGALDNDSLTRHAEEIGLDVARFRAELETHAHTARVDEDVESAEESGVIWTPTFFINGVHYGAAPDFDALARALEEAREAASA